MHFSSDENESIENVPIIHRENPKSRIPKIMDDQCFDKSSKETKKMVNGLRKNQQSPNSKIPLSASLQRVSSNDTQRKSIEKKVLTVSAHLKANNILNNNSTKIPNDVSTKTFKRGLSLHDTLCTASFSINKNNLSSAQKPTQKHKLIPEYKDVNQNSDSTSMEKINRNPFDTNLNKFFKAPQDLGMATPEKKSSPSNLLFTPQEKSKEKVISHEASFQSALDESFDNNTRMDIITTKVTKIDFSQLSLDTPKIINSRVSQKNTIDGEEITSKAEFKMKQVEEIRQILDERLDAVVELINESINNNATMGNNLLEFRKSQAMLSPRSKYSTPIRNQASQTSARYAAIKSPLAKSIMLDVLDPNYSQNNQPSYITNNNNPSNNQPSITNNTPLIHHKTFDTKNLHTNSNTLQKKQIFKTSQYQVPLFDYPNSNYESNCACIKKTYIEALKEYAKAELFLLDIKDTLKRDKTNSARNYDKITDSYKKERSKISEIFNSKNIPNFILMNIKIKTKKLQEKTLKVQQNLKYLADYRNSLNNVEISNLNSQNDHKIEHFPKNIVPPMDFSSLNEEITKIKPLKVVSPIKLFKDNAKLVLRKNAYISNPHFEDLEDEKSLEKQVFPSSRQNTLKKSNNYTENEHTIETSETNLKLESVAKFQNKNYELNQLHIVDNLDSAKTSEGISSIHDFSVYDVHSNDEQILNIVNEDLEEKSPIKIFNNSANILEKNTENDASSIPLDIVSTSKSFNKSSSLTPEKVSEVTPKKSSGDNKCSEKNFSFLSKNEEILDLENNSSSKTSKKEMNEESEKIIEENNEVVGIPANQNLDVESSSSSLLFSEIGSEEVIEEIFQALPSDEDVKNENKNPSENENTNKSIELNEINPNESSKSEIGIKNTEHSLHSQNLSDINMLATTSPQSELSVSSISAAYIQQQETSTTIPTKEAIIESNSSSVEQEVSLKSSCGKTSNKSLSKESKLHNEEQVSTEKSLKTSSRSTSSSKYSSSKTEKSVIDSDSDKNNKLSSKSSQDPESNTESSIPEEAEDESVTTDESITEDISTEKISTSMASGLQTINSEKSRRVLTDATNPKDSLDLSSVTSLFSNITLRSPRNSIDSTKSPRSAKLILERYNTKYPASPKDNTFSPKILTKSPIERKTPKSPNENSFHEESIINLEEVYQPDFSENSINNSYFETNKHKQEGLNKEDSLTENNISNELIYGKTHDPKEYFSLEENVKIFIEKHTKNIWRNYLQNKTVILSYDVKNENFLNISASGTKENNMRQIKDLCNEIAVNLLNSRFINKSPFKSYESLKAYFEQRIIYELNTDLDNKQACFVEKAIRKRVSKISHFSLNPSRELICESLYLTEFNNLNLNECDREICKSILDNMPTS